MKSFDKGEWIVNKGCEGGWMEQKERLVGRVSGVERRSIKSYERGNGVSIRALKGGGADGAKRRGGRWIGKKSYERGRTVEKKEGRE
jgi:hypothetical protein